MAPGSEILLWESFSGSVKATHTESLAMIGSVKRLSWLENSTFVGAVGGSTFVSSSNGCISLLKGGRTDPVKPGQPYAEASISRVFGDLAVLPG